MSNFNNLIIVLNGPSASGKTTIMERLISGPVEERVDLLTKLITVTTRPPRPGEREGVDYNFLTPEQFDEEEAKGNIVEKTVYAGVKYGILDSEIKRIAEAGRDAIVVLDMHGVEEMKRFYGEDNVVSIFVYRSLSDIKNELWKRPVPDTEKQRRYEQARKEMENMDKCDYIVYNVSDISNAVMQAGRIITQMRKERKKRKAI